MIGFIGAGNMASAIIAGMCKSDFVKGGDIAVFDLDETKTEALKETFGVTVKASAEEIAETCEKIILAVKPNVIASVLSQIDSIAKEKNPLFISIAAGKTTEYLLSCVSYEGKFIRVMPNINALVGAAVSGYCGTDNVSEKDMSFAESLCECFGTAVKIDEKLFPIFSAIGGCSPAFTYMYIDALARAAVKNGMPKAQALQVAAQSVLGSAKTVLESADHPWALVDRVCSPGGTTIEGVASLQRDGFEAAVMSAVQASFDKDKKI
ncbi:MAG: pyrroline-5-carboxylate reductase [Clostridia bacterium]|nr:pyrroline-5-carboxylate reductase [Clostridia bacterium]